MTVKKMGERTLPGKPFHAMLIPKEPNHLNPAIFDCDTILVAGFKDLEEAPSWSQFSFEIRYFQAVVWFVASKLHSVVVRCTRGGHPMRPNNPTRKELFFVCGCPTQFESRKNRKRGSKTLGILRCFHSFMEALFAIAGVRTHEEQKCVDGEDEPPYHWWPGHSRSHWGKNWPKTVACDLQRCSAPVLKTC